MLASLVTAAVLVAGFGLLTRQPAILLLEPHVLFPRAESVCPVEALGLAQHDVAMSDGRSVFLLRLLEGEAKVVWQSNFPQPTTLEGSYDFTGDGIDEIALAMQDSTSAEAIVLDASGREWRRYGPLHGVSARSGFPWDGRLIIRGWLPHGSHRDVLCIIATGFGREPRGVVLYDGPTGAELWRYPMGGVPTAATVAEVANDEIPEIFVATASPANGVIENGMDDSRCYLLALDGSGRRLWQLVLGGNFATSEVIVLPASEAGRATAIATFQSHRAQNPEPGRLVMVDASTGRILESRQFEGGLLRPCPLGSGARFVVGSSDGWLRLFGPGLDLVRERRFGTAPIQAWASAILDRRGDPQIVASTSHEVLVLDQHLNVHARRAFDRPLLEPPAVAAARAGLGHSRLVTNDGRPLVYDVMDRFPLADPGREAALAGIACLAWLTAAFVQLPRRWRSLPAGSEAREFLLDYHQIRHETFERERPFSRLRLWVQARAVGQSPPSEMLESAREEYERIGLPTLQRFVRRARDLGVASARVKRIRDLAGEVRAALGAAGTTPGGGRDSRLEGVLASIDQLSESCAEVYWEVAMRRPCRADHVVQEALVAKRHLTEEGALTVRYESDPSAREWVLFDCDELRALVAELVENAVRALRGVQDPALTVSVSGHPADPRRLLVRISDNGPGIPHDRLDAVFAPENSPRPGGGFGLFHARETARRWLGDLVLEPPPTGRGVVVRLTLRMLGAADARRETASPQERFRA